MALTINGKELKGDTPITADSLEALLQAQQATMTAALDERDTKLGETLTASLGETLKTQLAEAVKGITPANPTTTPTTTPKKGDEDQTAALKALLDETVKPLVEKVTALETERTQERTAAQSRSIAEKVVAAKYPNLKAKAREVLIARVAGASPKDDAAAEAAAKGVITEWATAQDQTPEQFLGANKAAEGGKEGGGGDSEAESKRQEKIESLQKRNDAKTSDFATKPRLVGSGA